jgi:hypothetical protein
MLSFPSHKSKGGRRNEAGDVNAGEMHSSCIAVIWHYSIISFIACVTTAATRSYFIKFLCYSRVAFQNNQMKLWSFPSINKLIKYLFYLDDRTLRTSQCPHYRFEGSCFRATRRREMFPSCVTLLRR